MLTLSLTACGGNSSNEAVHPPLAQHANRSPLSPAGVPQLAASPIARVPAGTFGPYLGVRAGGALAVWASASADARSWFARPLSASGETSGEAVRLGDAPSELGLVTVRPLAEGFALLSSHKTSDGEVVALTLLSGSGALLAGPTSLGRSSKSLLWIEAIANARGANVLWAASDGGRAEIWSTEVSPKAELLGPARLLARDVGAWQAAPFGNGIALAVTHVSAGKGNTHGPIELSLLGGADAPAPIVINGEISADLDLDMASLGERVVLAWSDHRGGENRVFSAAVDRNGKLVAPAAPATPPLGEQAVLRVIAPAEGSTRGYLAWEALDAQAATYRSFQVAEFQANGRVSSPRGLFEYWKMDGSMPRSRPPSAAWRCSRWLPCARATRRAAKPRRSRRSSSSSTRASRFVAANRCGPRAEPGPAAWPGT